MCELVYVPLWIDTLTSDSQQPTDITWGASQGGDHEDYDVVPAVNLATSLLHPAVARAGTGT